MIIQVDDILAVMLNDAIAETKRKFAAERNEKVDMINMLLIKLTPVLDLKADENTLRQARVLAIQFMLGEIISGKEPFAQAILAGANSYVQNKLEEIAQRRQAPMSLEQIINEFKLSQKAAGALEAGATIGELFLLQPSLFV